MCAFEYRSDRYFVFHRHWVFQMDVDRDSIIEIDRTLSAPWAMPSDLTVDGQERMPVTESPPASANEVHNINLLLGAIVIGAQVSVRYPHFCCRRPRVAQALHAMTIAKQPAETRPKHSDCSTKDVTDGHWYDCIHVPAAYHRAATKVT